MGKGPQGSNSLTVEKKATILLFHFLLVLATYAVALFTLLAWFAGFTPPQTSWFITVLGLAMMPLIIVNVLLLLWWIVRRKWIALVPAAVILLNIGFILSVFRIEVGGAEPEGGRRLKVASYNIHGYAQQDVGGMMRGLVKYLRSEGVDVVCFQEFPATDRFPVDSIRTLMADYLPYGVAADNDPGVSVALFSRYLVGDHDILRFEHTANGALWADIDVPGEKIRLFNVHFQTTSLNQSRQEIESVRRRGIADYEGKKAFDAVMKRLYDNACKRNEQVDRVRAVMDTTARRIIVCGDFNDTPASYTYKHIKKGLYDGFRKCGNGYAYTYKPMMKLLRVDYIFYDKRFEGLRYQSPSLMWSDHNPVLLELRLGD